jgi:hypothetical protein
MKEVEFPTYDPETEGVIFKIVRDNGEAIVVLTLGNVMCRKRIDSDPDSWYPSAWKVYPRATQAAAEETASATSTAWLELGDSRVTYVGTVDYTSADLDFISKYGSVPDALEALGDAL